MAARLAGYFILLLIAVLTALHLTSCRKQDYQDFSEYRVKRILYYEHYGNEVRRSSTLFYENNKISTVLDSTFNQYGSLNSLINKHYTYYQDSIVEASFFMNYGSTDSLPADKKVYLAVNGLMKSWSLSIYYSSSGTWMTCYKCDYEYSGENLVRKLLHIYFADNSTEEWQSTFIYKQNKVDSIRNTNETSGMLLTNYSFRYSGNVIKGYLESRSFGPYMEVTYSAFGNILIKEEGHTPEQNGWQSLIYSRSYIYDENNFPVSVQEKQYGWCYPDRYDFIYEKGKGNLESFLLPEDRIFYQGFKVYSLEMINHLY